MEMQKSPDESAGYPAGEGETAKTDITLCVYADGKLTLRVDDGEDIPVESIDQALAGIKAFATQEAGEGSEMGEQAPGGAPAGDEEAEFSQGFKAARGGVSAY